MTTTTRPSDALVLDVDLLGLIDKALDVLADVNAVDSDRSPLVERHHSGRPVHTRVWQLTYSGHPTWDGLSNALVELFAATIADATTDYDPQDFGERALGVWYDCQENAEYCIRAAIDEHNAKCAAVR